MSQLPIFQPAIWTLSVSALTRRIRDSLEADKSLQDVWVEGEISNLSTPSSGHLYFTLKDAGATLRCVMWRSSVRSLGQLPRVGDAVEVHGHISVYDAGGQYQLYSDLIRPRGAGALYQRFLELQERLKAEGLFDEDRKRPIPVWPQRIGIVTSPTGAALQDILNTLRRRFPLVEVILAPTLVQGDQAPPGIVAALQTLNVRARPDVILLARGGGSIEDLWAFNDERVVRAVYASETPVITGVGHETDFTLTDFAADLRAPTPTAAAELSTPNRDDLLLTLSEAAQNLYRTFTARLNLQRMAYAGLTNQLQRNSPLTRVRSDRQRLDTLTAQAGRRMTYIFQLQRAALEGIDQQLSALSPQAILTRGYAIVTQEDGRTVRRAAQVQPNEPLNVRVQDGSFGVRVDKKK
jgi:exodeoxyribonuclease VII large subunit